MSIEKIQGDEASVTLRRNAAAKALAHVPMLSVVIPFYSYDVSPLAARLNELAASIDEPMVVVFLDDGSPNPIWYDSLWQAVQDLPTPFVAGKLSNNVGRARIRNFLCQITDSPYLLYLDADMWPDRMDFLARYLAWARSGCDDIIYGGRSADKVVLNSPAYKLHRDFTRLREQIPATVRRETPAYSFYSCNFLVPRRVLNEIPLNTEYKGWGWEDCEWAIRASEKYTIRHEDNPASHLGLLVSAQILQKYDESVDNFRMFFNDYPDAVCRTALVRVARWIGRTRTSGMIKWGARAAANATFLPTNVRLAGLMLYKAALYAPVVYPRVR